MTVYVFFHNAALKYNGGMRVLFRVADAIQAKGYDTKVLIPGKGLYPYENPPNWKPDWFDTNVEVVDDVSVVKSDDIVIMHEEAVWAFDVTMVNKPRYIMINQGAQATFTSSNTSIARTKEIYNQALGTMVVSKYIEEFVSVCLKVPNDNIHNIGNVIDPIFKKSNISDKVNNILVIDKSNTQTNKMILSMIQDCNPEWSIEVVKNYSIQDMAAAMAKSKILLFFCSPTGEGLGLSPIEAGVSCCKVIGYSGTGGREYFNQYGGIFSEIDYNDVTAFIETANRWVHILNNNSIDNLINFDYNRALLEQQYSLPRFEMRVQDAFERILNG